MLNTEQKQKLKILSLEKEEIEILSKSELDKIKEESTYSGIHYMITIIFFMVVLVNTIYLTKAVLGMKVQDGDVNVEKAKNLISSACIISYFGDFLIIILAAIMYWKGKNDETIKSMVEYSGVENMYVGLRIAIFSILMIVSLLVGSLCISASKEIEESPNKAELNSEKHLFKEVGQMFILHFLVFTLFQIGVTIWKIIKDSHNINK